MCGRPPAPTSRWPGCPHRSPPSSRSASATPHPRAGDVLTLAGWGATTSIIPTPSTRLSIGQVKIQTVTPTTVRVVASSPAADTSACLYDSGAPYFTTPVGAPPLLVSAESTGPDCPHTSAETTARVDTITTWITTIVTDLP